MITNDWQQTASADPSSNPSPLAGAVGFIVKLHGVIVGRSELEDRDPTTRSASGVFRKGAGYELVEPVFALRAEAADADRFRKARGMLPLELYDAAGASIRTSALDIEGVDGPGGDLRLRATVSDRAFWDGSGTQS